MNNYLVLKSFFWISIVGKKKESKLTYSWFNQIILYKLYQWISTWNCIIKNEKKKKKKMSYWVSYILVSFLFITGWMMAHLHGDHSFTRILSHVHHSALLLGHFEYWNTESWKHMVGRSELFSFYFILLIYPMCKEKYLKSHHSHRKNMGGPCELMQFFLKKTESFSSPVPRHARPSI